jgi:1-deoxy-D-xylulose-5-phosphate synthase
MILEKKDLKYLNNINSPEDLKKLNEDELEPLAQEIREVLIDTVSHTGGHLASNLGVVELTIAIHRMFNSPKDRIVWDVGHQAYVHKLLTGRLDKFDTLRQEDGISGFCHPNESEHDTFYSGHSGTSISSAYGIAQSNKIKNNPNYTVAVIGDGSFTGGLVYEAMNNAGRTHTNLIVILNDNQMSISKNVGSVAKYLTRIRSKKRYVRMKAKLERILDKIPFIGHRLASALFQLKTHLKNFLYESTLFEKMGFRYMGPIDGHNIPLLCEAIDTAKSIGVPVLLHVKTIKGKGYDFAEKDPCHFHGISNFNIDTGEWDTGGDTFCNEFGNLMCKMAKNDKRITLITAAMSLGTGLTQFSTEYSERFFDVGIAEEHAVTFASGLSKGGMLPVFAVYSTFLQRCYDEIIHDGAMQKQKLVLAIDRAGFVGDDGESHNGLYDVAFLQSIPGIIVYSPSTYDEMKIDFGNAFYRDSGVVAVRYPRGGEGEIPEDYEPSFGTFDLYGHQWANIVIVTYGRLFSQAAKAVKELLNENIKAKVLKLNRIKPVDDDAVKAVMDAKHIYFYEEGVRSGGVGEKFAALLLQAGYKGSYELVAVEDCFVKQAKVERLIEKYGLDSESMVEKIRKMKATEV